MELVYLWVDDYKNIKKQEFNFSPRFRCEYDEKTEKLSVIDKEKTGEFYPKNFFGDNINVTAIVGENGSGKSSVFEFLINEITEKKNYVCVVYNKEKKKIRFTTNNKSIYQKNLHYGYIQNKVIRKYFGYINISPHENTIKHEKINKGFDFSMASDKFRASEFDKYLEESKNELTTTQDIKLKQLLNEVKEFVFINTNNHKYSSGEKAMLYYLTCIYIMLEINSNLIVYIDEVELFLHPMWQKRAIKIFIESLKNKITKNIHIVIASHSPFILSDLPKENIIFLEKGKQVHPFEDGKQTFGANIHTLLSHGFFMKDGLMGEFAKDKIDTAIKYLNQKTLTQEQLDYCENIISIIGEPIIKRELQRKLDSKRLSKLDKIDEIEKQMKIMEEQRKLLEHRLEMIRKNQK